MKTTLSDLKQYWDICLQYYSKEHKRMKLLDMTDKGGLWKAIAAVFPPYQILPDTNYISYVKNNILASIYTVAKSADIMATSEEDISLIENINIALDKIWNINEIGFYQYQAGERAALTNIGITQIGWDDNKLSKSDPNRGGVVVKNIDPIKFMRDPFATGLDTAGYCLIYDILHKSVFLENSKYAEEFKKYVASKANTEMPLHTPDSNNREIPKNNAKDYYTLICYWVKEGNKIHEIHTVNNEVILYAKEDIKPSIYPFAILYCNLPSGSLIGTSECAKIFANNVAYNLMDSIALTAEYKNQRPPKFISSGSGLNINAFNKYGNEADHTFVVQGDATKAVHYHQFPFTSPNLPQIKTSLMMGIEQITGVDGKYTGRDTGSIITTGGVENMLNRATLVDTPKIMNYEKYTKELTKLILYNFIEFSPKRKYFYKPTMGTKWQTKEIDFPKISADTLFDYDINISSDLPNNKQRIAQIATMMMEKQMQYGNQGGVTIITEEEWLRFQDLPFKEQMLERMGIERLNSTVEDVTQTLFQYANLVKEGLSPDDAILATANSMDQKRQGIMPPESPIPPVMQEDMGPME